MNESQGAKGAGNTRGQLIEAALELFGQKGYDASSVREIAGKAGVNLASIGYHFGGKEGLRQACAAHAAGFLARVTGAGFAAAAAEDDPGGPTTARGRLVRFLRAVAHGMLTEPGSEPVVRFLLREITSPSGSFSLLYSQVMVPTHQRICELWASVTGEDPNSEAVRLGVFAIFGQAIYFRIGLPIVTRRMGWERYGEAQIEAITDEILANLDSALTRHAAVTKGEERTSP